ncbi:MAG: hypothetical protein A2341_24035 [Deltaproteobacteria bacterium RIFOXYB12_FULL_58_9]|nr:MAG: hypothetical protein A2341_24035 [Deltaproteobacteria bacterium RIFOXYB12_FULL_58_9]
MMLPTVWSCSFVLDWDIDRLPCDERQRCAVGYSCVDDVCVSDQSIPHECDIDDDCDTTEVCVTLLNHAKVCRPTCHYGVQDGVYYDDCASTVDALKYCQALGPSTNRRLVCLDNEEGVAQNEGDPCHPLENPCAQSLTCYADGKCHAFCIGGTDNCTSPQSCQTVESLYQICL